MLFQYILILLVVAIMATVLGFNKNVDPLGRVFFTLWAGILWCVIAISMLKIKFIWGGDTNVISYTYIPSAEAPGMVWAFGGAGLIMFFLGLYRAWQLGTQPLIDNYRDLTSEKKTIMHDL